MEEIEVKFLNIDPEAIQKKFADIGAKKSGEYFYRRRVFDYPDWRLDKQGAWLRLRDEGDRITLSFKQRLGIKSHDGSESDDGMEEVEIIVDDFDKTALLLVRIGFVEKHYAENKRIRWVKDEVEFDIDTFPELEPYLEIEARSWEKIDEAILWLDLNPADKKIFSANQIYALKGINVADYARITFDGMLKKA
ncbi:MAG: Adenylate cyclase, class 2 (Thermophilic) [Parcubacteria group bacterium GW2011_GWA2_45_30]|nr:MAG: Adenylate cyclase, class 2 (Thermophilic) [Parcubacteria group bacterium GW2011_GWA2_45_30]